MFAAWLNHVDAKGINSLSALVTENGRTFIRHYLLDFGSALGSAAIGPREGWEGSEELVERPGEIGRRIVALGLRVPAWRTSALLRGAERRPAAAVERQMGAARVGAAHHEPGVPAHAAPTTRSGPPTS